MQKPTVTIHWDADEAAYVLSTEVILPQKGDIVFDFFSDAFQLERITPDWLNFRILTPPPIEVRSGCLIDYRIRLHGIPIRWRTEISSWDPPYSFTDRQLSGPYRLWEHFHTFEEVAGGTLVSDRVRYRALGGKLVNWLFVQSDLKRIFSYRGMKMREIFASCQTFEASGAVGQRQRLHSSLKHIQGAFQ